MPATPMATPIMLPEWMQWLQAISPILTGLVTAIVAIAVATVAYRQWRTARHKLVLDLFERRYSIFDRVKSGVDAVMRDGDARGNDGLHNVAAVRLEAAFLFGPEITDYLLNLNRSMAELGLARSQIDARDEKDDWPQRSLDASLKIMAFYDEFPVLLAPYMKMDQRLY